MQSGAEPCWEHFSHDADMGVRGYGRSAAEAFEQAALALTAVVVDPAVVEARTTVAIQCEAPDLELLLLDWLNALVFEMATRHMLFRTYEVEIEGRHLKAQVHGEAVDPARHEPAVEVKGATLTMLTVRERGRGGWMAQCVVDV